MEQFYYYSKFYNSHKMIKKLYLFIYIINTTWNESVYHPHVTGACLLWLPAHMVIENLFLIILKMICKPPNLKILKQIIQNFDFFLQHHKSCIASLLFVTFDLSDDESLIDILQIR